MDRTEISEIFCGAVDAIVNARLKNLSYDITKEFVITKNDLQRQGIYTVSDGSVNFEAYSYDKTLKVNDKVMVTIPNGDYNSNKIIVAKLEPEKPDASEYASQLDLMQIFTENLLTTHVYEACDNTGVLANDQNQSSYIKLYELHNNQGELSGYSRLGISAEFQSLLNNLDVVKGDYGLKLLIFPSVPRAPGDIKKEQPYVFDLSASDMIGNPYKYSAFSKQQKVIDISIVDDLARIEIYLYQNGDFQDSVGNLIKWEHVNNILEIPATSYPNNIFVKNIELYLGYELGEYENDKMQIYCQNSLYYSYADINKVKNLQLKWLHKFDNGQYKMMDMQSLNNMGITLKWYRYNSNSKSIDSLAGRHWEEIPAAGADKFRCNFTPNTDLSKERIKVIGSKISITKESVSVLNDNPEYLIAYKNLFSNLDKYKDDNENINWAAFDKDLKALQESYLIKRNGDIESIIKYESDEIVFTNTVEVFDISTFNATSALSIQYKDGSDGNYYIYNTNGKLPSANKGRGYEREMQAIYNGQTITPALGTLDYIEWWLPTGDNSKTMLAQTSAYYVKNGGQIYRENEKYAGVNYICIRRFPDASGNLNTLQSYSINNNWSNTHTNNLIRCEVSINGIRHICSSTMHFGKSGTQGSNTTLILELMDNNNAITIPAPKNSSNQQTTYTIEAKAFDINGNPISPSLGDWKWGWKNPMPKNNEGKELLALIPRKDEPHKVDIEININSLNEVKNGYYGIVQASFKQLNELELTTYLALPLKAADISHIEGATDITYSASGAPTYYADAYRIFTNNSSNTAPFTEILNVDWDVVHDLEFYKLDSQGHPIINDFTGEKEVSAMSVDYVPKLQSLLRPDDTGRQWTYQALQAAPFFAEGYDKICVTCARDNGNYKSVGFLSFQDYINHYYYIYDKNNGQFILSNSYLPKTEYFELQKDIIWIQPLLITTNLYENATTNNWDGTLMTDEGSGTIMATIVGAGRKNSDNTFSGVLMGEVKDNADSSPENFIKVNSLTESDFYLDSYYYKDDSGNFIQAINYDKNETYYSLRQATGLYGFQNGEISFSLKDTGIATFGKSGRGQIIIDGNTSIIKSQSFTTLKSGMQMDLDEGTLEIKDNGRLKVKIAPYNDSYLLINGSNEEKPIMKISGDECFLQSQQRSLGGLGTHFDLVQGILDINGTGGNVLLSGRAQDPFFKVTTRQNNTLIHMDTDEYYLQSAYFTAENQIRLTDDELQLEIYKEKDYVPVAISIETYMNEMDKYYVFIDNKYIAASGDYNCDVQYYRLGNDDVVYGFDPNSYNLYTLAYDEEKDKYTARVPIDAYECDDVGNFVYPIMWYVEKYEKDYEEITLTQEQFNENKEDYYAKVDGIYISAENQEWKPDEENGLTGTYYQLYYYPKNNEISGDSEETIIGTQIYNYVQRELTPVRTRGIPSGMKLDLVDGKIEGYNLKLVGTKIKDDGQGNFTVIDRLIINTEDDELPLQIGKNFRVHWDGEVECTKVTKISYTKGPLEDTTRSVMKKVYKADSDETVEEEVTEEIPQTFFIDFVNGEFNGVSSQAGEALSISDDILNTWWTNKNSESQDDNHRHFNVFQLKQYLQDYYIPIRKNIVTGEETLSDYAKTSELNSLRQTVNSLSNEVAQLRNLITGIY